MNPAVTLNAIINGGFDATDGAAYAGAQMVGATLASALTYFANAGGIRALEKAQNIVRGSAASASQKKPQMNLWHLRACVGWRCWAGRIAAAVLLGRRTARLFILTPASIMMSPHARLKLLLAPLAWSQILPC